MGRYRYKKTKKLKNNKIIIMFCIAMFFIGSAYASLNQMLALDATVTVAPKTEWEQESVQTGNLNFYITELNPGVYNSETGVYEGCTMSFYIENPNDFRVTNWFADIEIPGLYVDDTHELSINVLKYISSSGDVVNISNPEGSSTHAVIDANGGKTTVFKEIHFNTTEKITTDKISANAYTLHDTYEFEDMTINYGSLRFEISSDYSLSWDGSYITKIYMNVTNIGDKTVTGYGFDIVYNDQTPNEHPDWLASYDKITKLTSTETESTWSSTYNLAPNETSSLTFNAFYSTLKFKAIKLKNIWYTVEGSSDTNDNIIANNTVDNSSNNTVENIVNNTVNNTVSNSVDNNVIENNTTNNNPTVDTPIKEQNYAVDNFNVNIVYTDPEVPWTNAGFYNRTATISITNTSDTAVSIGDITMLYNTELANSWASDGTYTMNIKSSTTTSMVLAPYNSTLQAGATLTYKIISIATETEDFDGITISKIEYSN